MRNRTPAIFLFGSALLLSLAGAGRAQEQPLPYASIQIGQTMEAPAPERARALEELARQEPSPKHVVVLIHGWDTPEFQSRKDYAEIARVLRSELQWRGESAAVLGLQWDSDAGALRRWLPKSIAHHLLKAVGLKNAVQDPYKSRVLMARTIGRRGARQVFLDLQARFPKARIHVLAHSLGSEITLHALDPNATPRARDKALEPYRPDAPLRLDLVALAGADVDQDVALRNPGWKEGRLPRLLWLTLPQPGGERDRALILRKIARGKPALGDGPPHMTADQLDRLLAKRQLVFDTERIPPFHEILRYYDRERLGRIAGTMAMLRDPASGHSPLLKELDAVLAAPDDLDTLYRYLDRPDLTVQLYALWRVERLLCGSSKHLANGYAFRMLQVARDPKELARERAKSPCHTVSQGLWPLPPLQPLAAQSRLTDPLAAR